MKFRSFVLCACMLIVPLLAMFSHRIPAQAREAIRTHLWNPAAAGVVGVVERLAGKAAPQPPADAAMPVAESPAMPNEIEEPSQPVPAVASAPVTGAVPSAPPPTNPRVEPMRDSPPVAAAARGAADGVGAERLRTIETSLTNMGAVSIRCQPLQGHDGMHVGSCQVAVDSGGQLQRVFQAAGNDPTAAMEHLLEEVTAWRSRIGSRPAGGPPSPRTAGAIRL
jgi:hypothetical protein